MTDITIPSRSKIIKRHSKTNTTKFVIFTAQRTGSTYLCELLSKHSSILMNYEIFNKLNDSYRRIVFEHDMPLSIVSKRIQNPGPFLENIWRMSGNRTAVGFKIFYYHIHKNEFLGVPYFDSNQLMNGTTFFKQASTTIDKRISNWNKLPENIQKYSNVNMSMDELISVMI
eukprot:gene2634-5169_t